MLQDSLDKNQLVEEIQSGKDIKNIYEILMKSLDIPKEIRKYIRRFKVVH